MNKICRAVRWLMFGILAVATGMSAYVTAALLILMLTTIYAGFSLIFYTGLTGLMETTLAILLRVSVPLTLSILLNCAGYAAMKNVYNSLTKTLKEQIETQ